MNTQDNRVEQYWEMKCLKDFYLEDSFLLDLSITRQEIVFSVEAVLKESSKYFKKPEPKEIYSYKKIKIKFTNYLSYRWLSKSMRSIIDLSGSMDYGNIDNFFREMNVYTIRGDWGYIEITSNLEPEVEYC